MLWLWSGPCKHRATAPGACGSEPGYLLQAEGGQLAQLEVVKAGVEAGAQQAAVVGRSQRDQRTSAVHSQGVETS